MTRYYLKKKKKNLTCQWAVDPYFFTALHFVQYLDSSADIGNSKSSMIWIETEKKQCLQESGIITRQAGFRIRQKHKGILWKKILGCKLRTLKEIPAPSVPSPWPLCTLPTAHANVFRESEWLYMSTKISCAIGTIITAGDNFLRMLQT